MASFENAGGMWRHAEACGGMWRHVEALIDEFCGHNSLELLEFDMKTQTVQFPKGNLSSEHYLFSSVFNFNAHPLAMTPTTIRFLNLSIYLQEWK